MGITRWMIQKSASQSSCTTSSFYCTTPNLILTPQEEHFTFEDFGYINLGVRVYAPSLLSYTNTLTPSSLSNSLKTPCSRSPQLYLICAGCAEGTSVRNTHGILRLSLASFHGCFIIYWALHCQPHHVKKQISLIAIYACSILHTECNLLEGISHCRNTPTIYGAICDVAQNIHESSSCTTACPSHLPGL